MDAMKFVWLCSSFLVFSMSLLLLSMFWQIELIRLAGLYTIVPGIGMLIANGLPWWFSFKVEMAIVALSEISVVLLIVYFSDHLYRMRLVVPWMLLACEAFRWLWLIVFDLFSSRSVISDFEVYLVYFYYLVPFVVLLYCSIVRNEPNTARRLSR